MSKLWPRCPNTLVFGQRGQSHSTAGFPPPLSLLSRVQNPARRERLHQVASSLRRSHAPAACCPQEREEPEMSHRLFNFSAGPAMLPTEALEKSAAALLDYQGKGF